MSEGKHLSHHHAFMIILLVVFGLFVINIVGLRLLDDSLEYQSTQAQEAQTPVILTRVDARDATETVVEPANSLAELEPLLDEIANAQSVNTSIFVQDISSGDWVGHDAYTTYISASMYKLFVAYEVYARVDAGELSLFQATGYEAGNTTIGDCLDIMISISDNPCGRALRKVIGVDDAALPSLAQFGFYGTNLMRDYPTTSARDVGLLFQDVYFGARLSEASNSAFLDSLKNQSIDNRLPQGIPADAIDVSLAHKTGDLEGFAHDGGILYTPSGDYIVVIMSGPWDDGYTQAPPVFADAMSQIYSWLAAR